MNLILNVSFFDSALSESTRQEFSPDNPLQVGMLLGNREEPIGIDLMSIMDEQSNENSLCVESRILNPEPDMAGVTEGAEFFLMNSGKLIGRGSINKIA